MGGSTRRLYTVGQMQPTRPAAAVAEEAFSLDYLLWLTHWMGSMRHPRASTWSTRLFYVRQFLVAGTFLYFSTTQAIVLVREGAEDLARFTITMSLCDTGTTWLYRLSHITIHESDFHRLAEQVGLDFGRFMTSRDEPLLRTRGRALKRFVQGYIALGVVDALMWFLSPIKGGDGLPLVVLLPFDISRTFPFVAAWLLCAFATVHAVVVTIVTDSFNVSLIAQLRMQLILLSRNICELSRDVERGTKRRVSLNGSEKTPYPEVDVHYIGDTYQHDKSSLDCMDVKESVHPSDLSEARCLLLRNILHHQAIISNVNYLQRSVGGMILAQSLSLGAAICFLLFMIGTSAQGARETGKFCGYMCAMFTELFVYCWFGDQLMFESEKVALSAYDAVTSLLEYPASIKRSLLLLMHRVQRPLCITAAGFFPLSRESFVSILNASYSFFAILRNFKED